MSLVNTMLRDLDRRRAGDEVRRLLPDEVRPLPDGETALGGGRKLALGLTLAYAGWQFMSTLAPAPVPGAMTPPPAPPSQVAATTPPALLPEPAPAAASPAPSLALPLAVKPISAFQAQVRAADSARLEQQSGPAAAAAVVPVVTAAKKPEAVQAKLPAKDERAVQGTKPGNLRLDANLMLPKLVVPARETPPTPRAKAEDNAAKPAVVSADPAEEDWRRAQNFLRERRNEQAEPLLRRVLSAQPAHVSARQALLGLLLPARRLAEAAETLREGLALNPAQPAWAMNLARIHAERNDYAAAWEVLSHSLPHAQQNADYQAFCGTVLQRLNRQAEAQAYYRQALQLKPREARWWAGFGIALEADGKPAEARDAYQHARSLGDLPPEVASFVEQKLH